eukprot:CAMPEP_0172718992 /NCGR_PEP_ID=MMETSP1074-20121228/75246_1 /TAXON_ID=2916 /ORGANISM="Ceratium fusus, Strain PA161109" /LENGTH=122 /DNA_ID=CAMNT_0013544293 /DNA_START=60 /DNA_END=428 /DNA_ORIENTATION=-
MALRCHARWARCRAPALSPWARHANFASFDCRSMRGLTSAGMLRIACAERLPSTSFAEQRVMASSPFGLTEAATLEMTEDEDRLAAIVKELAGLSTGLSTEMLSVTILKSLSQIRWPGDMFT